jgi:predicted nuclease of predicted toxin-antitoxin system
MRLLADENMPRDVVAALRRAGHDVVWIREQAPASSDQHMLETAQAEQRIVLTFELRVQHVFGAQDAQHDVLELKGDGSSDPRSQVRIVGDSHGCRSRAHPVLRV